MPKSEGGLGIKKIWDMNVSGILKQGWAIATKKDSLWFNGCIPGKHHLFSNIPIILEMDPKLVFGLTHGTRRVFCSMLLVIISRLGMSRPDWPLSPIIRDGDWVPHPSSPCHY
ncbi:hypothetical protein NE237_016450 [Protea cynaroides]|uniref:Uncharacterized protein n=1 Tax=Protea cynaroides TaxID=273540 RepID=A0A9Q0HG22_9MAGN|nr:hypothetical protein NE237_016450 [Protea cynaroides]